MKKYIPAFQYIGIGSLISQILIIREFLVSFYGNELSIGIIFACWLFWIGIGSSIGDRIFSKINCNKKIFSILIIITPFIVFIQIAAIRFSRYFLQTPPGEYISIVELLYFSFLVLSVGCMLWGSLFTCGANLLRHLKDENAISANYVYKWESFGSAVGGLLFSFILINLFNTFQIINFLFFLAIFTVFLINKDPILESPKDEKKNFLSGIIWKNKIFCLLIILIFILSLKPMDILDNKIDRLKWLMINSELSYIKSKDTHYQNLALLSLADQFTVYSDGKPAYNIPDTYNAEVFTHLIMAQSDNPKSILIIGGGFSGLIKEVLKYNVENVDYVEIDPELIKFVNPVLSEIERQYLMNQGIEVINDDGRNFINTTENKYDVILLYVGEPTNAGLNRYYTREFFGICKKHLNENGIVAFPFPSSEDYFGKELMNLNASIFITLKEIFLNILIIPGTSAIFIGSNGDSMFITNYEFLAAKYKKLNIKSIYFSEYLFEQLMLIDRIGFVRTTLENDKSAKLNTDANPVTYYFDMILWNKFLKGGEGVFEYINNLKILEVSGVICLGIIVSYIVNFRKKSKRMNTTLNLSISVVGFAGIIFNLVLILSFQTAFGAIYEMIGGLIASNMIGLTLGAFLFTRFRSPFNNRELLNHLLFLMILFSLILPYLIDVIFILNIRIFPFVIIILAGIMVGMLFGVINSIYLINSGKLGNVYSYDLYGSAIGSLISSSILIPIFGIAKTRIMLVIIISVIIILNIITFKTLPDKSV